MNRDTVKTLAGLVIIGVIVVATFLYGNTQRQNQLKHDAAVKQQQAATGVAKASPSGSAAPASSGAAPASSGKAATNTAPVQSPGSSSIQGGSVASSAKPDSTPTPSSPAPSTPAPSTTAGQVAGAATVPQTGGNGAPLPQTGNSAPVAGVIGLAAIATMWLWVRRSRRAVFMAARNNR